MDNPGAVADSSDLLLTADDVKVELEQALDKIDIGAAGTFATSGVLTEAPVPGLSVEGYGLVGLPLSKRVAKDLIAFTHQAPFGKGSATVVNTDVRNTWEVDAGKVELQNPEWACFVDRLLETVTAQLGIVGGRTAVRADLYKLLLYEEGAFFEKHRDSEKAHGMFGTLVIALPSQHSGGDVKATFQKDFKTLRSSPSSAFQYSYLAWYADVEHAVENVTSGYRLVLTYNLIHASRATELQSAQSISDMTLPLRQMFHKWADARDTLPTWMAYMLDHKYTDANLRLNQLKGRDRVLAAALTKASDSNDATFFLANVQRSVTGAPTEEYSGPWCGYDYEDDDEDLESHHSIDEIYDESCELRVLVYPDGTLLAREVNIYKEDIVQENGFEDVPSEQAYEDYTGNEGPDVTHFYRKSAFILMPKSAEVNFVLELATKGKTAPGKWLEVKAKQPVASKYVRRQMVDMSKMVLSLKQTHRPDVVAHRHRAYVHTKQPFPSDTDIGCVLRTACVLNDAALFTDAAKCTRVLHSDAVLRTLGARLKSAEFGVWEHGVDFSLAGFDKLHTKHLAISQIREGLQNSRSGGILDANALNAFNKWASATITKHLTAADTLQTQDAEVLANLAELHGDQFLMNELLDAVKRHLTNKSFVIEFANRIAELELNGKVRLEAAKSVFHDILFNLASDFRLEDHDPRNRSGGWGYALEPSGISNTAIDGTLLSGLIDHGLRFKLHEPVSDILEAIKDSTTTVSLTILTTSIIPLLPALSHVLEKYCFLRLPSRAPLAASSPRNADNPTPTIPIHVFRNLYSLSLSRYFRDHVRTRPAAHTTWARPKVQCSCRDCSGLNVFLADPERRVKNFNGGNSRRAHLHQQLNLARVDCTHETRDLGSPQSLLVTKTDRGYRRELEHFEQRLRDALDLMSSIDVKVLGFLLGKDKLGLPLRSCTWVKERLGEISPAAGEDENTFWGGGIIPPLLE